MTDESKQSRPIYHGMRKYMEAGGYAIWMPSDWQRMEMLNGHQGAIFTPHAERFDTCFSAEKVQLKYAVTQADVPLLREGFTAGLQSLPGIEIESQEEKITPTLMVFEARFTFLEGDVRRKRWIRNVYWGDGLLILIAQGATSEEFEYWLPMLYNTMTTLQVL